MFWPCETETVNVVSLLLSSPKERFRLRKGMSGISGNQRLNWRRSKGENILYAISAIFEQSVPKLCSLRDFLDTEWLIYFGQRDR